MSLPHATYLLATAGGRVVEAAPIARWMIGKPEAEVAAYLVRKRARLVELPPLSSDWPTG